MAYIPPVPMSNKIPPVGSVTQQGNSTLDTVMKLLNSPGGAALVGAAGAGISAYGANKSATADRELNANQFAANMAQNQLEGDRANQLSRAGAAASASPIGESQDYAQRQALLSAILPGLRNSNITPGDSRVAGAMGSNQGGLRLPEGGLDPAMIERMFGANTTLGSIQQRQNQIGQINPNGPVQDMGSMFGQPGTDASDAVLKSNQAVGDKQAADQAKQRQIIMAAIDNDLTMNSQNGKPPEGYEYDKKTGQLKKKGSFLKTLGKVGLLAGGGALMATGFGGPAGAALIGAGIGAGNSALNGGGVKGALLGAGLGAATGGIGGPAVSSATSGLKSSILNGVAKNPALYSAILGR